MDKLLIYRCDQQNCGAVFDSNEELDKHKDIHKNLEITEEYRKLLIRKLNDNKVNDLRNNFDQKNGLTQNNNGFNLIVNQLKVTQNLLIPNVVTVQMVCNFPKCNQLFDNEIELRSHEIIHKKIIPNDNNMIYGYIIKIRDDNKLDNYLCVWPQCQYRTTDTNLMSSHLGLHLGSKPFKCHYINCFERFASKNQWKTHQLSHYYHIYRELNSNFSYCCLWNNCSTKTDSVESIEKHIENHFKTKSFKCDQQNCNKEFANKSLLTAHQSSSLRCRGLVDLSYYFDKRIEDNNEVYVCEWSQCLFKTNYDSYQMSKHIEKHYKNQ